MLAIACLLASGRVRAEATKEECKAAFEEAQSLQKDGKYLDAGKRALGCTNPACGDVVVPLCTTLQKSIGDATSTIVVGAHDGDQNDLVNVRVTIDGQVVREQLDGKPLSIDPGVHVFRFEAPGLPPVEKSQTIHAGEKLRMVSVTLGAPRPQAPALDPRLALATPPPVPPKPSPFLSRSTAVAAGVVGGLGALAFGGFGYMRWAGMHQYDHLSATCSPNCRASDVNAVRLVLVSADVSLGVGVAAAATVATLLFGRLAASSGAEVRVIPQKGGGAAQFVAHF